jgi:hypothetical protein
MGHNVTECSYLQVFGVFGEVEFVELVFVGLLWFVHHGRVSRRENWYQQLNALGEVWKQGILRQAKSILIDS